MTLPAIIIDTQEKKPFSFSDIKPKPETIIRTLKTGDYSLDGYEGRITIERKSLADLYLSIGAERERFEKEMNRMVQFDFAAVICESDWEAVIRHPPAMSDMKPRSVYGTILAWMQRYYVHWIMCPNRAFAEKTTFRILERWYKDEDAGLYHRA